MKSQDPIIPFLILYLTQPNSKFYISKLIAGSTKPQLEPFKDSSLDLGPQTILGETMNFSLKNLVVQGLSNVQVVKNGGKPEITVNGNNVTFTAKIPNTEAPPTNIPKVLTLVTSLNVTPKNTPAFGGNLTVTVKTANLIGSFDATSVDGTPQKAEISFDKLQISASASSSNINIDLEMNSPFTSFIESILSQEAIINRIMSGVNATVNQPNVLGALSNYATITAREALKNM
ncbi:hypothetical protein [uncultured Algibacter sp.]|uniref:hypothetical protein n=1 Tax=uncultured Algibacter sp. TaxID=298659 RepID=UPI0032177476